MYLCRCNTLHRYTLQMVQLVNEEVITLFPQRIEMMKNILVAVSRRVLRKRTCCGSWMLTQFRSSTCWKNFTTSHTKSSGTKPKVILLTCLGTRLPAGRQIGKRAVTRVFQCQMYTQLWQAIHAEVSYSRMVYIYRERERDSDKTYIYICSYIYLRVFVCFVCLPKLWHGLTSNAKKNTKNDPESVLCGLKSPVLVFSDRYHDISSFPSRPTAIFTYRASTSGSCLDARVLS